MEKMLQKILVLKENAVREKEREIECLSRCMSTTIEIKERVQISSVIGRQEEGYIQHIEKQENYKNAYDKYIGYRKEMLEKISGLNEELYDICYKKYFLGQTWMQISKDLGVSYVTIMKKKKDILNNLYVR